MKHLLDIQVSVCYIVPDQVGTQSQVGTKRSQKEAGPFKKFFEPRRNHVLKFSFSKSLREGFHPWLELVWLVLASFSKILRNKQFLLNLCNVNGKVPDLKRHHPTQSE